MTHERIRSVSLNFVLGLYAGLFSTTFLVYQLGVIGNQHTQENTVFIVAVNFVLALCTLWALHSKSITDRPCIWVAGMYVSFGTLNLLATLAFGVSVGTGTSIIISGILGVVMMFMIVLRDA